MFKTTNWHLQPADGILMPSLRKYSSLVAKQKLAIRYFMSIRLNPVFIFAILLLNFKSFGQTKILTGLVIIDDLRSVPFASIEIPGTDFKAETDVNGKFKIEVPIKTDTLIISQLNFERKYIILNDSCYNIEVILMYYGTSHFATKEQFKHYRKKRLQKMYKIHKNAYNNGIFMTEKPCYQTSFFSNLK